MVFNKDLSYELIKKTLYSKGFYSSIQKTRMYVIIASIIVFLLGIVFITISLILKGWAEWYFCLLFGAFLMILSVVSTLILSIVNTIRIKKFVTKRYNDWIIQYYLICSENIQDFEMNETITKNEFVCSYKLDKFVLKIVPGFIEIVRDNHETLRIDNSKKNIFNHKIDLKKTNASYFRKDPYFVCNSVAANQIIDFINDDINYILFSIYGNH